MSPGGPGAFKTGILLVASDTRSGHQIFGMPNPASVETPKEWEAGRWRLSKVPDPACKIDPIPEAQFLECERPSSSSMPCAQRTRWRHIDRWDSSVVCIAAETAH
eukprot:1782619-Rhodomonas_salina.2